MNIPEGMRGNEDDSLAARLRRGALRAALGVEQRAAAGLASGAVQGAADQLQALSDDDLRDLLRVTVQALERLAAAAAHGPGELAEEIGSRAAKGAVESGVAELKESLPRIMTLLDGVIRLVQAGVDRREAEARVLETGRHEAARTTASAMVAGGVEELELHASAVQALTTTAAQGVLSELGGWIDERVAARGPGSPSKLESAAEGTTHAAVAGAMRALREELGGVMPAVRRGLVMSAGIVAVGVAALVIHKRH